MGKLSNDNGFTLIEILVAMLLFSIGVLAATYIQQNSLLTDQKTRKFDEANRLLAAYAESINLHSIDELQPDNPRDFETWKGDIISDMETGLGLNALIVSNGISLYRLVSAGAQGERKVDLCASWHRRNDGGGSAPQMLFRTVIKPLNSET